MTNRLTIESVEGAAGQQRLQGLVHRSLHTVRGSAEEMRIVRCIREGAAC